jgi:hypothetical protein
LKEERHGHGLDLAFIEDFHFIESAADILIHSIQKKEEEV